MAASVLTDPCNDKVGACMGLDKHDQSVCKSQTVETLTDYDEGYSSSDWTETSDDDCASPRSTSAKNDSPFSPPLPPPGLSPMRNDLAVHKVLPLAAESNDSDEEDLSEAAKLAIRRVSTRARTEIIHVDMQQSMVDDSDDDDMDLSESAKAALRRFAKFR